MTEFTARPQPAAAPERARSFLGVFVSTALLLSGCAARKKPSVPWSAAVLVRPVVLQHPAVASGDAEEAAPDLQLEIPTALAPLPARGAPARPRVTAPTANPSNGAAGKPDTPQIVPELSTQESTYLQRETKQNLAIAERNLAASAGKSLTAAQADLASKVRSFISDAKDAGKAGDWARARDLAKKAQVLSEELAGSL
jgi:outer membrane murein-binding lipoprotein Lpp